MSVQIRGVARLTAVAVTAAVLATVASGPASATAFPHLTLGAAQAALPVAKTLPGGHVKLVDKVTIDRAGQTGVCNKTVALHDLGQATAVYTSKAGSAVSVAGTDWALGVAVFAIPAKAAAAMHAIVAVERTCPIRQAYKGKGAHIGIHITASAAYSVDGWTGYRTTERQVIYLGKTATPVTQIVTFLVRGNALVTIVEATTGTHVSPAVQESRRKLVQTRLLAALTHPKH